MNEITSQLSTATAEEPTEAIAALVIEYATRAYYYADEWSSDAWKAHHHEFATEVLRVGVGDTAKATTRTEWGVKFDAPGNGYPGEERIEVFESEDAAVECVEGRTRAVIVSRQVTEWVEATA